MAWDESRSRRKSTNHQNNERNRSKSTKRQAEDETTWKDANSGKRGWMGRNRFHPNVESNKGTGKVPTDLIKEVVGMKGLGRNLQYYIGQTSPNLTDATIKEVLIEMAKAIGKSLTAEDMQVNDCTPKQIQNPYMRSWKVQVNIEHKELFDNPELYPPTWNHREFVQQPRRTNDNKRPRNEPSVSQQTSTQGNDNPSA